MNWGPIVQSSHIYILLSKPSKRQKCAQKMGNKMNYLLFIFSLNNYEPTIFKGFNFSLKGDGGKGHSRKLIWRQTISLEDIVVEKAAGWGMLITEQFKKDNMGF